MRPLLIAASTIAIAGMGASSLAANMGQPPRYSCQIMRAGGKTSQVRGRCPCLAAPDRKRCLKAHGIIRVEQTEITGQKSYTDSWTAP